MTGATFGRDGSGVTWESLDMRYARLDLLRFFGASIANCLFDAASLQDLRLWGVEVEDCSFRRADLSSSLLTGQWQDRRNVWRRVAFDGAKMRERWFEGCVLDRCSFGRNGYHLAILDCEVTACTFAGEWRSLIISGSGHRFPVPPDSFSADFSRAEFRGCSIFGYRLDRTTLPQQEDLIVIRRYAPVLRSALRWCREHAASDKEKQALGVLEVWVAGAGADDSDCCFDLRGMDAEVAAALVTALEYGTG